MTGAPLNGLTVLELCQSVAGPYIGMILGDLGCRVIKVERPGTGDDTRAWGPPFWNGESAMFLAMNRNKESVTLDLKTEAGQAALHRLLERADILVQNYRPGVLERMGFDYQSLAERYPSLIYCTVSAFGSSGPLRELPGYDPLIQAFSGMMSVTGEEGGPPVRSPVSLIDQGTGMWAAIGILSALYQRREGGRGGHVEVSLLETGMAWLSHHTVGYLATGKDPQPQGSGLVSLAPYQAFQTRDGSLMIAAGNDGLFQRLCAALGHPEWVEDRRFRTNGERVAHRNVLADLITAVLRTETTVFWENRIHGAGVPCTPIHRISDAVNHPQTEAVELIQPLPHPAIPQLRVVGHPVRWNGKRPEFRLAPPRLGAHTETVLRESGMTDAEITAASGGEGRTHE
jgi:crotonobetainyl-CoA:carnitine CoA-transferase CaiB-like acyl-CoA transferase